MIRYRQLQQAKLEAHVQMSRLDADPLTEEAIWGKRVCAQQHISEKHPTPDDAAAPSLPAQPDSQWVGHVAICLIAGSRRIEKRRTGKPVQPQLRSNPCLIPGFAGRGRPLSLTCAALTAKTSSAQRNYRRIPTLSACVYPPKPVRPFPNEPKPPRELAVARVIGVFPTVAAGRVNCEVLSLAEPLLLEKVLDRVALVKRPSEDL
jgi:hypothetical protein